MWIEKPQSEVTNERRSSSSRRALIAALVIFFLFSITTKIGYNKRTADFRPISWNEYFHGIPLLVGISVGVFLLTFLYLRKYNIQKGSICMKCERTFPEYKIAACECGGQIRPVIQLKWVGNVDGQNKKVTDEGTIPSSSGAKIGDPGGSNQAL